MHIGILDDDISQQGLYHDWLLPENFGITCYSKSNEMTSALEYQKFDLIIINWTSSDSVGMSTLKWIRDNLGWQLPIIVISSRDSEQDIVSAFKAGADDYVAKPAKQYEVIARIQALLRRSAPPMPNKIGNFTIKEEERLLTLHDEVIELTQKEFELACYVLRNTGKLLSRVHLLGKIWGLNSDVDTRTIDTHMSRIRKKLLLTKENGWNIIPIYGYGYRLEQVQKPLIKT